MTGSPPGGSSSDDTSAGGSAKETAAPSSPADTVGNGRTPAGDGADTVARESLRRFLDEAGIPWEHGTRSGEVVVTLPGEKKLSTVCSVVVGEQSLSISAFVMRNPDENHEAVYAYLLRRNLRLPGLAYAIDRSGDIYVSGRVPLAGVSAAYLDQIFGVVLEAADGAFNELLALGFLESMKKEWAWRSSRGESTRNLEAFRHLLATPPEGPAPAP